MGFGIARRIAGALASTSDTRIPRSSGRSRARGTLSPQRLFTLTALFFLPPAADVGALESTSSSPPAFILEVDYDTAADLLSVHAHNAILGKLLDQVAEKANVSIEIRQQELLRERVSVELRGLSVEQALRQLLRDFNSAFLYASPTGVGKETSGAQLAKVVLLSKIEAAPSSASLALEATASASGDMSKAIDTLEFSDAARAVMLVLTSDRQGLPEIIESLKGLTDDSVREQIIEALLDKLRNNRVPPPDTVLAALKELAPERAIATLTEQLGSPSRQFRVFAASWLGSLRDEVAIGPLVSALRQSDPVTREAAAASLAQIGGPRAMGELFQAYLSGDSAIRYPVAVAIASHADPHSQATLSRLMARGETPGEPILSDQEPPNSDAQQP